MYNAPERWKETYKDEGLTSSIFTRCKSAVRPYNPDNAKNMVLYANGPHPGNTYGANACCRAIRAHSSITAGTAPSVKASRPHCSSFTWTSGGKSNATSAWETGAGKE